MGFVKGMKKPANSGRKKGSLNKKKVAKVADYLAERDINPAAKLLDMIKAGQLEPRDEAKIWLDLMSYCEPKARHEDADDDKDIDPDDFEDVSNDTLLTVIKGNA